MHLVLFEDEHWKKFLPLVYTRPVGDLRIGILKIAEKWAIHTGAEVEHLSRPYLKTVFREVKVDKGLVVNARLLPDPFLAEKIKALKGDEALMYEGILLAARFDRLVKVSEIIHDLPKFISRIEYDRKPLMLQKVTDLFTLNHEALQLDFDLIIQNKVSEPLRAHTLLIGPREKLFIEPGAKIYASTLNTETGPIYIGKNSEVMEGAMIRGPFSLGENSTVKMGTKIYGATTIGPHCKVGGEISNSVIAGFSNKAHDGFIGNSIIGEWCNLGADTNTSNLRNNYSTVKVFDYAEEKETDTGLTFCGLLMADHSKCGINTMFNTGTVVGVNANIFGGGFPPKHIPSYSWGGAEKLVEYDLYQAITVAERVMARRQITMSPETRALLTEVYWQTASHRTAFAP